MEPQQPIPTNPSMPGPVPAPKQEPEERRAAHTYKDDLTNAMNVTEAPVVQAMLADAREREAFAIEAKEEQTERKWYSLSSLLLILLTLAVAAYGTYYYTHLTVKIQPTQSVGVFQSTDNIVAGSTTIQQVLAKYAADTALPVGKPTLINLVTDSQSNTLLSNSQLYSFIAATVPEPLQGAIGVARLGVLNTGTEVVPFIIVSVTDPETASKEFSIAEPDLLQMFGPALGIDLNTVQNQVGQTFQSQYFYNLPVRTLSTIATVTTQQQLIFLYGYVNNNIIVISADPQALKGVYDTIINQH